jgi:hypothetical protein
MGALLDAIPLPDLGLIATDASMPIGNLRTVNVQVRNRGEGEARNVVVTGVMPAGVMPVGIADPGYCRIGRADFSCTIPRIASGQSHVISVTVGVADVGSYEITAEVSSEDMDADSTDNGTTSHILATATAAPPPPAPVPEPAADMAEGGGGCTLAVGRAGADASLSLLLAFGALGLCLQRLRRP